MSDSAVTDIEDKDCNFISGTLREDQIGAHIATQLSALAIVDELVARTYRIPRSALYAGTRCRKSIAFARQVSMYLGHVVLSYPLKDIAQHYQRDRTTVAYACRVVEDRREEEETELLLSSLESALQTMMMVMPLTARRSR